MSVAPWNEANISLPPVITLKKEVSKESVEFIKKVVEDALIFYESQTKLQENAAYCSRIIARRKNSFREFRAFKDLCKVNSALCRLLRVDIIGVLRNFSSLMPDYALGEGFKTNMPTKQNFDYLLLRLITLSKLFNRISICCEMSSKHFGQIMKENHFFDIITVILGLLSDIYVISNKNGKKANDIYKKLISYRKIFPTNKNVPKTTFDYPNELEDCFTKNDLISSSNEKLKLNKKINLEITDLLNFDNDSGDELSGEHRNIQKEQHRPVPVKVVKKQDENEMIDEGVIVSRDTLNTTFNINFIKKVDDIQRFIKDEDNKRNSNLMSSSTKNIKPKDWIILKRKLFHYINCNDFRSAIKVLKRSNI